ncbi:MAG: putative membrane protein YeiH [Moritella sp.]|jgi:uncharacterized membrane protein YeiH
MNIDIIYLLDLAGVAVFAISGVQVAGQMRMDPFGATVLAAVTAIGGGTIRDTIIGADPVFWVHDPTYLTVIIMTSVLTMLLANHNHRMPSVLLPLADAAGLALFTVLGAQKALAYGTPAITAVVMGVITGVAGGIIRDILASRVPMVLQKEIYATASVLGGLLYTASLLIGVQEEVAMLLAMAGVFLLRMAAVHWHLSLPIFVLKQDK